MLWTTCHWLFELFSRHHHSAPATTFNSTRTRRRSQPHQSFNYKNKPRTLPPTVPSLLPASLLLFLALLVGPIQSQSSKLQKPLYMAPSQSAERLLIKNWSSSHHFLQRHPRSTMNRPASTSSAVSEGSSLGGGAGMCVVQFVERRSCRPISAPVDWDELNDDSSTSVEPTDSAELRYHAAGYNAPTLRLTPYNDDPHDEATYFIERQIPGKPGVFTLQTLSTREFVCVSRRGRLRLQQAPTAKRRCWWSWGRVTFGTYGQQRHSIALVSARHYPNIAGTRVNGSSVASSPSLRWDSPRNLTSFWAVGFRQDGRPLPVYAPKIVLMTSGTPHDQHAAVETFLFTRLVASHAVHEAHNMPSGSCRESFARHNNYARHLTFCQS